MGGCLSVAALSVLLCFCLILYVSHRHRQTLEGKNSLWVRDGHLQDEVFGDLEQLRVIPVGLQQEREDVKTTFRGFPSQLHADLVDKKRHMS